MQYFTSILSGSGIIFILMLTAVISTAQTPSTYDKNGNVKTISERRYEESRNNQNKYTPTTTPANNSYERKTPGERSVITVPAVVYDYYAVKDGTYSRAVRLGKKWGYIDPSSGNELIPVKYDELKFKDNGYYGVKLNGKWGFVDKEGKIAVPIEYDDLVSGLKLVWGKYVAQVIRNGRNMDVNEKGKDLHAYYKPEPVLINGKSYDTKAVFSEGLARVISGNKVGYIDESGSEIIPLKYDYHYDDWSADFSEGLVAVRVGDKWGFIDKTDKMLIPLKYEKSQGFHDGLALVKLNTKWGFIDKAGKTIIPFKYKYASVFKDGLAAVSFNGRWGYVDKHGKEMIPVKYDKLYSPTNGYFGVKLSGKYGFVDKNGITLIPCQFDEIRSGFNENGIAEVTKNGSYISLNLKNKNWVTDIPAEPVEKKYYDDYGYGFHDGLKLVKMNDSWGYIDSSGKEAIPLLYDNARDFAGGFANVGIENKQGLIDKTGKVVIPLMYGEVGYYFSEGCFSVKLNWKWGFVDNKNNIVIPFKYDEVTSFSGGFVSVKLNGAWGFVDKKDNGFVATKYEKITNFFGDGLAIVMLNGKYGYINSKGIEIIPPIYNDAYAIDAAGKIKMILYDKPVYFDKAGKEINL